MGKKKPRVAEALAPRRGVAPGGSQMKKKTDLKPKCLDEQEIPYKLREIMKSRDELKNSKSKKKKRKAKEKRPDVSEDDIPVPKFKRRKGETEWSYIMRMEQETQHVMFLAKNQQQREPEKEEPIQEKSQKRKEFQRKKQEKARKQKEEKKIAKLEKEFLKDPVEFGEVALQPPVLTVKPRKSVVKDKAGQRQLLLTSLLSSGKTASTQKASLARQRIVLEERERVVQAYRDMKKQKQHRSAQAQLSLDKLKKPV
nr:coiled-coil domain-containing protein 137 isoform X1 [Pogona vitticeps]